MKKVLVANRGEIAMRVLRTCRRLGLSTVAIHSEADASAEFVSAADAAIALGGNRVQESYLDLDKLEKAIRESGADAVHPGYGMLSEDPRLVTLVTSLGATFIGPSVEALSRLGDKLSARALARSVGLAPPPGTERAVAPEPVEDALSLAEGIGYPVMVKAASGGGGIGMQVANTKEQLEAALRTCASRGQAAFGDARVYIEHAIGRARHVEVQVARDAAGNLLVLGDRECSAQRRHQKVLEECPSPAAKLTDAVRDAMYQGSTQLLALTDYVGVATVEFLLDCAGPTAIPYFLEVNARIQVEHPTTEMVFGVDIVELQLALAKGEAIPPAFMNRTANGCAIEVRIYAEDPARGFLPQPGTLTELAWPPATESVRVDAGYRQGDVITPYYDPLIGKLICHGNDRKDALAALRRSLAETRITLTGPKGPRASNVAFLRDLLDDSRLISGDYDTTLLSQTH